MNDRWDGPSCDDPDVGLCGYVSRRPCVGRRPGPSGRTLNAGGGSASYYINAVKWSRTGDSQAFVLQGTEVGAVKLAVNYLRQGDWGHFATVSTLAALSGPLDRVIALRLLSPEDYNAYFII